MRLARLKQFRHLCPCLALMVAAAGRSLGVAAQVGTGMPHERTPSALAEVIVTARVHPTDEQVTAQVERALTDDPYVYAQHVTVTLSKGVLMCQGIVGDSAELHRVLRICRGASGSKRVIVELQINDSSADGG